RLEFCGWTPFPTLSISDAERRAYHNRRVSDARYPQRIFDTLWILVRSDLLRLGATVPLTSYLSPPHFCLFRKKNRHFWQKFAAK
ncbi:MAG: hypothetical protein PT955_00655, partial [Bacteroidales bacterium]|nr:hypothetical protein [Bacteroidales bacterium]